MGKSKRRSMGQERYRPFQQLIEGWVVLDTSDNSIIKPEGTNKQYPEQWAKHKAEQLNKED